MSSRLTHVVARVRIPLLLKAETCSIVRMDRVEFIPLVADGLMVISTFGVAENAAMTISVQIPVQVCAFNSLVSYPEVELLDQIVIMCLIF